MRRGVKSSGDGKARTYPQKAFSRGVANVTSILHGRVRATFEDHPARIQQLIIHTLRKLNGLTEKYTISISGRPGTYEGWIGFEIGVGEGVYFNYLDDEVVKKLCELIGKRTPYSILEFLIIVTYHCDREGKSVRLNFDYHQLSFIFSNNWFEMRLFHSKGIRRMPLDELVNRILKSIKDQMRREDFRSLIIEDVKVL